MSTVAVTHLRACIIEAARAGNPPRVIAEEIGATRNLVKVILSQERARGIELPKFRTTGWPKGKPRKPARQTQRGAGI